MESGHLGLSHHFGARPILTRGTGHIAAMPHRAYVLIDGENLDATLDASIVRHGPKPVRAAALEAGHRVRAHLGLGRLRRVVLHQLDVRNATWPFVAAIQSAGFGPVLLSGSTRKEKAFDVGIQRTVEALMRRDRDVQRGSHDRDFLPQVEQLIDSAHGVAILGFARR